ncbi:MAG: hypothetical protein ACKOZT_05910 [Cyanobium sp.]
MNSVVGIGLKTLLIATGLISSDAFLINWLKQATLGITPQHRFVC